MTGVSPVADQSWKMLGDRVRGRKCGSCTLCCTLVPVELSPIELKPSNVRCRFLSTAKRCTIYTTRPRPCEDWSCKWLFDEETAQLRRPDLGGYIIDPVLDTLLINDEPCDVVQVWIDPARPHAHRAPELRDYLGRIAARIGIPAIVRRSQAQNDSVVLLAPALTLAGWVERDGTHVDEAAFGRLVDKVRPGGRYTTEDEEIV
ncbi:MAG: YkgJ family cysteine cluster protein [Janthinobacterium lividum]